MTLVLDTPVIVGETVVAALCRNTVSGNRSDRYIAVTGAKRPVALLIRRGDQLIALNPSGDPMTLGDVERLCPGVMSQFETAAAR